MTANRNSSAETLGPFADHSRSSFGMTKEAVTPDFRGPLPVPSRNAACAVGGRPPRARVTLCLGRVFHDHVGF